MYDASKSDPNCGKIRTEPAKSRAFVVGAGGELADVVIYIKEGVPAKTYDVPAKEVVLDQVGCEYVPYVFAFQTGQKVAIKNSDPVLHNVNCTTKSNKPFNQAQIGKGPDLVKTFDTPEIFIPFQCNVHPWMFSYGSAFNHPYFAVSGADGTYKISNLPAGKYTIEASHRKAGKASKEITVGGDNQTVDFTLELKPQ